MMSYYYRYETKGIQSWILSSNKLRDLSGGSALVEELTQVARTRAEEIGGRDIQATSGAMTAVFPHKEALERFAGEWPLLLAHLAPGLHMIHAWVNKEHGLSKLFEKLAGNRNQVYLEHPELNPWVLRSGRSGLPAIVPPQKRDFILSRRGTLDSIVLAKERALSSTQKKDTFVTGGNSWNDFEENLEDWPDGPVAVIHADGSGIGERLRKFGDDLSGLITFSKALQDSCRAAIREAVRTLPSSEGKILARPIVAAGDDLTYIVPARYARRFTEAWILAFEKETLDRKSSLGNDGLFGGAGIAFVS